MKASLFCAIVSLASASSPILGEQSLDSMQKMEASGDTMGARTALARAAQASPNSVAAWTAYAEFLDRYGDPAAREAYGKLIAALRNGGDSAPPAPPAAPAHANSLPRCAAPAAREAYGNLIPALRRGGVSARAATVARRLALLDLL